MIRQLKDVGSGSSTSGNVYSPFFAGLFLTSFICFSMSPKSLSAFKSFFFIFPVSLQLRSVQPEKILFVVFSKTELYNSKLNKYRNHSLFSSVTEYQFRTSFLVLSVQIVILLGVCLSLIDKIFCALFS